MNYFESLGRRVDQRWRAAHYSEAAFPRIAHEALNDEPAYKAIDSFDPIRWLLRDAIDLPKQVDLEGVFGQPPLVMFATSRFIIQVLYWLEATTSIHQHAFCGAFQVLGGSSLHSEFTYQLEERINSALSLGTLSHQSSELLSVGSTRTILPNHDFIHSLYHLDQPSVTVVVRTIHDDGSEPQYDYNRAGLAWDPSFKDPLTQRQVQALLTLGKLKHDEATQLISGVLARSDLASAYALLIALLQNELSSDRVAPFIEALEPRLGTRVALFKSAVREVGRRSRLIELRKEITDPELRFFLALLLNLRSQGPILSIIAERYPSQSPKDLIIRWLSELSADPAMNRVGLGVELDDAGLLVARCALDGLSHEDVLKRFAEEYEPSEVEAQAQDLAEAMDAFRRSFLLDGLFRP